MGPDSDHSLGKLKYRKRLVIQCIISHNQLLQSIDFIYKTNKWNKFLKKKKKNERKSLCWIHVGMYLSVHGAELGSQSCSMSLELQNFLPLYKAAAPPPVQALVSWKLVLTPGPHH
jgi:hypothetical protein